MCRPVRSLRLAFVIFGQLRLLLQVTVELKNDLAIQGTLHSVDQYLNIKLHNTRVVNEQKYPHMVSTAEPLFCGPTSAEYQDLTPFYVYVLQMSVRNCFIRGSVVRYVQVSITCIYAHIGFTSCYLFSSRSQVHADTLPAFHVQLPPDSVDIEILHDATRREARGA